MSCKIAYLKRLVKSKLVAVTLLEATGSKEPSPVQQLHSTTTPGKARTKKVPTDIIETTPFSPGGRYQIDSVAGTRYPPLPSSCADTDSDPASMLSPQSKERTLKTYSKAPSRVGSKAPSAMSPGTLRGEAHESVDVVLINWGLEVHDSG